MKTDHIILLLKKAYAAELETVQNYLANSVWLDGLRAQRVVEALTEDVADELGHAQRLAQRLKQLGACPPGSLALVRNQESLQPAADSTDLRHVIAGALAAEQDAIATYLEIIAACTPSDPVTADVAVQILSDEERHRSLFDGFLKSLDKARAARSGTIPSRAWSRASRAKPKGEPVHFDHTCSNACGSGSQL